jgi:hypothetical protein
MGTADATKRQDWGAPTAISKLRARAVFGISRRLPPQADGVARRGVIATGSYSMALTGTGPCVRSVCICFGPC